MFCPQCGRESAAGANFCSVCGARAASVTAGTQRIVRPRSPRMVAGVCSGVAIHYGWDVALVRILFVIFVCVTTGAGALLYAAGWLLLPDAQYALPPVNRVQTPPPGTQGSTV